MTQMFFLLWPVVGLFRVSREPFGLRHSAKTTLCEWDVAGLQGVLETKKLDNKLKSPVIHHITSSMTGVNIIRYL
jgi:hypothetical protein